MIVIFYFMLLCISSCLQRTCIDFKIRKKTINVIKNEKINKNKSKNLKIFRGKKKVPFLSCCIKRKTKSSGRGKTGSSKF